MIEIFGKQWCSFSHKAKQLCKKEGLNFVYKQLNKDFSKEDFIYFYGDMMNEGQNDFPLADAIRKKELGFTYHVHSFQHTWDILSLTKSR